MKLDAVFARIACAIVLLLAITVPALAQSYPATSGRYNIQNFVRL